MADAFAAGPTVELEAHLAAPPEVVWEWIADHERMREWMPVAEVVRRRPGRPDENGAGAVRTVRCSPFVYEEEIVASKPPERMEWVLKEGAPVREMKGEVLLTAEPGGTRIRWRLVLRPLVPGTGPLLRRAFERQVRRGLEGLAHKVRLGRGERSRIWPRAQRRLF